MSKTYVIGHKIPDTDSIVAALAMAYFLNQIHDDGEFIAARAGEFNSETQFVFDTFPFQKPELLENIEEQSLYLVDHNESTQIIDGHEDAHILGIVDHHKINFDGSDPIEITIRPVGSTCTVIFDLFQKNNIPVPEELKAPMLCAILSDTVILRSPTTTAIDREYVEKLSKELELDFEKLGMDMFIAKAQLEDKTPDQIIHNDYKVFEFGDNVMGVGQIETPDLALIHAKIPDIIKTMHTLTQENNYHAMILMLTDIIKEGSQLVIVSQDEQKIADVFNTTVEDNVSEFIPGMLSRKKQVVPVLSETF